MRRRRIARFIIADLARRGKPLWREQSCEVVPCDRVARLLPAAYNQEMQLGVNGTMAIRQKLLRCLLLWTAVASASCAWAGGGSENVLLVVNSNSLNSKTIANHYIALRNVPASNVVYIDWRGGLEAANGIYFASQILEPAITAIGERGLSAQIDYVVYSCDLPWKVGIQSVIPDAQYGPAAHPEASSTGVTYLWQLLRDKNPAIILPFVNFYVSPAGNANLRACTQLDKVESRAFHSRYFWTPQGTRTTDPTKGQSYLLSTMLGVTTGRGNTVDEILAYLKRSVEADGKRPRGTFYYMKNNDVRSTPRHACFDTAAAQLKRLGVNATVKSGVVPSGATDVLGIMTGAEKVNIAQNGVRFLPGAICDNLTSYGGVLLTKSFQTPLSDFLRDGASGASGTVFEPQNPQSKFALPSLFIHYARGCSLAESYYQSVAGPYMLLVVGDPLCQPFAMPPKVVLEGLEPGQEVKGMLTIKANATTGPLQKVGVLELFIDGRLVARFAPGSAPQLDTTKLPDGYHELRVVAVNADAIASRGRQVVPIVVNNHGRKVALTASAPSAETTEMITIEAEQAGATAIVVRQNRREVARFTGSKGEAKVLAASLGRGPVVLQAESEGPAPALSPPLRLEIR
jgi:uncharacterized protein (TIGR03790 family)